MGLGQNLVAGRHGYVGADYKWNMWGVGGWVGMCVRPDACNPCGTYSLGLGTGFGGHLELSRASLESVYMLSLALSLTIHPFAVDDFVPELILHPKKSQSVISGNIEAGILTKVERERDQVYCDGSKGNKGI